MTRTLAILLVYLTTMPVFAQVFPRIEKTEVKQRIATGAKDIEDSDKPDTKPDDRAAPVDGDKVLKRYNEILAGYTEREQKKLMTKHTQDLHISVRDYLEGIFLLRLGMYKDAGRKLDDVGYTIKRESEIATPELLKLTDEIKSGKAYYYRMMAVVLEHYKDFKDEKEAEAAWMSAAKDGTKVRRELERLVDTDKLTGSLDIVGDMTSWLITARREWLGLYKAERNINEHPESILTWQLLINSTGSKQNDMKQEYTPNYLKQRAALRVVKEFWPAANYVIGGWADVTLGLNHLGSGQIDDWQTYLEPKSYHTDGGKKVLIGAQAVAKGYMDVIEALKSK